MNKGNVVVVKAAVFGSLGDWPMLKTVSRNTGGYIAVPHDERLTMVHEAKYGPRKRNLWRYEYETPWIGMVTGWSVRKTGDSVPSGGDWDDYEQGYLREDKSHKVVMIQPLRTERWLRPIACLEEDVTKVDFTLWIEDGGISVEKNYSYPDGLMEHLSNGDDFRILAEHECPEALESSAFDLYENPERDAPLFRAHFSGEVIKETVQDEILWSTYTEVSMGGELLLLEKLT